MNITTINTGRLFPMFKDYIPEDMIQCDYCMWKLYCIKLNGITICPWCFERAVPILQEHLKPHPNKEKYGSKK